MNLDRRLRAILGLGCMASIRTASRILCPHSQWKSAGWTSQGRRR